MPNTLFNSSMNRGDYGLFQLSTSRLSEVYELYPNKLETLRYVKLTELREALAAKEKNDAAGDLTYIEVHDANKFGWDDLDVVLAIDRGQLYIGCRKFNRATTQKIIRATAIKRRAARPVAA